MSLEQFKTQVLILHSEQDTLDLLSTGFNDKYSVHCATSGTEALNTLGETPVHVIICAQDLPGMSGLEALREAKKRSPDMIAILLAGTDASDGLEAMVEEQEVFQIIRGNVKPDYLLTLVERARRTVRMATIAKSANDTAANMDLHSGEHIVMETAENGSAIVSDGTGTMPALRPERIQVSPNSRGRDIDVLVLSKDEVFLSTIKESSLGLHGVYHANTPSQAEAIVRKHKIGVLVTDAAMVGSNIEVLTQRLRTTVPRLVAIVAGRRDDGELLMDLINRGQVYRFLLKPVSPGRVRLAIEASVKHHLDADDTAFKGKPRTAASPTVKPAAAKAPKPAGRRNKEPAAKPGDKIRPGKVQKQPPMRAPIRESRLAGSSNLGAPFDDGGNFTETMTDIAASVSKSISGASRSIANRVQSLVESSKKALSNVIAFVKSPKTLAATGALIVVAIGATWMISVDRDDAFEPANEQPQVVAPATIAGDIDDTPTPAPVVPDTEPLFVDFLEKARDAQAAGNLVSPAGANAMEFYVAARNAAPDDDSAVAELSAMTDEVFSLAEGALLANRTTEAARALRVIGLADPESPRLAFLNVQLEQQQLRILLNQARVATRESRFADAGRLLTQAEVFAGADTTELDILSEELAKARSEQPDDVGIARTTIAEQAEADRLAAAQAAAIRAENERQATDQIAAGQAETDRLATEAAAAQAEADRIAAEETAAKQAEADRVAAEEAATKQAEADRVAAEEAAAKQAEADRVAAEEAATKQAEADRVAAEEAAAKQAEADRVAAEEAATKQAEADRIAAEEAAAKQADADRLAAEEATAEQAEADRVAAERAAAALKPVTTAVKRIHYVSPNYPRSARRRNISGWVDLSFTVTTSGDIADVEVTAAEPAETFNDSAITAIEQWRYEPATVDSQPIEKRVSLRLSFML